jgi:hypothetical protein
MELLGDVVFEVLINIRPIRRGWSFIVPCGDVLGGHDLGVEGGEVVERVFEVGRDGVLFVTSNGAEEALASRYGALPHLPPDLLVGGSDFGQETTPLVVAVVSG